MKKLCLILIFLFFTGIIFADKVITLQDIMKPESLYVNKDLIYITEGASIFMYSSNDFTFKKKIGKKGQGPQEFPVNQFFGLQIFFLPDKMYVISPNKLSYFTFDGKYLEEKKHTALFGFSPLYPLKDKFVGMGFKQVDKKNILTVNLYDSEMKIIKELKSLSFGGGQRRRILERTTEVKTSADRVFIAGARNFSIDVFDENGNKLYVIEEKYSNIKFTEAHKEEILNLYKSDPVTRQYYELIAKNVIFPASFPCIRKLVVADEKVYVHTFLKRDKKTEFIFLI